MHVWQKPKRASDIFGQFSSLYQSKGKASHLLPATHIDLTFQGEASRPVRDQHGPGDRVFLEPVAVH